MDNIESQIISIFQGFDVDLINIDENISLIESGIIDSMSFINALLEIEEIFNVEIDFENVEIESITSIKGLLNYLNSV